MPTLTIAHYLPILSTLISVAFAGAIFMRYRQRGYKGNHLVWWTCGVLTYGLGTFSESYITLFGLNEFILKFWYIVGALMGGSPLAQGTVWLLLKPRTAKILTFALIIAIVIPAIPVALTPVNLEVLSSNLPSGKALEWQWVRAFSPFINTYAVIFLVGGAILSAVRFRRIANLGGPTAALAWDRFIGNVCIATGAIMPAIGGTFTRFGYTPALYIGELIGIILIWLGYWFNIRKRPINRPQPVEN
ncbi:MAG: hypothetical protein V3W14_02685 [Candidatus Neomarinimicrobiota bacterium]